MDTITTEMWQRPALRSASPPAPPRMPPQRPGRSRQDYGTPPRFLDAVRWRLRIAAFALDIAASAENAVCPRFYTDEDNALRPERRWRAEGWSWLNPPFASMEPWVTKAALEATGGAHIAMLVPAAVGANWWARWVAPFAYVVFLNGRLTFVGKTAPYPKDCALLLYHPWGMVGTEVWAWRRGSGRAASRGRRAAAA